MAARGSRDSSFSLIVPSGCDPNTFFSRLVSAWVWAAVRWGGLPRGICWQSVGRSITKNQQTPRSSRLEMRRMELPRTKTAPVQAQLGLWDAVSIIIGIVIGAGIYETAPLVFSN